jgi:hypothetical protein
MRKLAVLLACGLAVAQTPPARSTLEQLGYPAGTKLLIIHADDLAVTHAANQATFDALEQGAVSSASIMAPCPWLAEAAAYAKQHPDADFGIHLTLTSEWKNYRWGPVARGDLGGLAASDGYLWPEVQQVSRRATPAAVEAELRAQIDRTLAMGIHPTHLDAHMACTLLNPAFFVAYVKLAREYGIPFFAPRLVLASATMRAALKDTDVLVDQYFMAPPATKKENWKEYYARAVQSAKPGLTEIVVHLSYDNAEAQAVMGADGAYASAWRQRDFDLVTSPEFRHLVADSHVTVIGWKQVRDRWPVR